MASLNHVCIFSEHGWERITLDEAVAKHPGGTVSAHSGMFMCELCGQYVTLTDGDIRERYFKHSANEVSKNCPDRTFGAPLSYSAKEYELPIKISHITENRFALEIGFLYVPKEVLNAQRLRTISIEARGSKEQYTYSFERLNEGTITYLGVGDKPAANYDITCSGELHNYWPRTVRGIDKAGRIFDGTTGKMLPYDADVQINKKYYLLTGKNRYGTSSISRKQVCRMVVGWTNWYLYEIEATALDKSAAKFFLEFHCRLTDRPISIQTIWPPYVETPYVIKHNREVVHLHVEGQGEISAKPFPQTQITTIGKPKNGYLLNVQCKDRQQLISAGRSNVLQYAYWWKGPLEEETPLPDVEVKDINGIDLTPGEFDQLPPQSTIVVTSPYDGKIVISDKDIVREEITIAANFPVDISEIRYGYKIEIIVGLDVLWTATYIHEVSADSIHTDRELLQQLQRAGGALVNVDHRMGAIVNKMQKYPLTKQWISYQIRQGRMPKNAIDQLKIFAQNGKSD